MKLLLILLLFPFPFHSGSKGKELLDMALEKCECLESLESYRDILVRYGITDKVPLPVP